MLNNAQRNDFYETLKNPQNPQNPENVFSSAFFKGYFKQKYGIPSKSLCFRASSGKSGWLSLWIKPKENLNRMAPLEYYFEFPLKLRKALLLSIYGTDCTFAESGLAGNIREHSLNFTAEDWTKAMEILKEEK